MKDTRKRYSASFKSKVALEAIKENKTIVELAQEYALHPSQIKKWKSEVLKSLSCVFGSKKKNSSPLEDIVQMERKIGQLVIENDFLRKNWEGSSLKKGEK